MKLCETCGGVMKERILFTSTYYECNPCPGPNGDDVPYQYDGLDFTDFYTYGAKDCMRCKNVGCDHCQPWNLESDY